MNVLTQVHKWQWSRHAGYCEKICKSPSLSLSSSQSAAEAAELILSITSHIMMVGQIRRQVKNVSSLITNSQPITTHTTFLQMSFSNFCGHGTVPLFLSHFTKQQVLISKDLKSILSLPKNIDTPSYLLQLCKTCQQYRTVSGTTNSTVQTPVEN